MKGLFSLISLLVVVGIIGWLFVRSAGGTPGTVSGEAVSDQPVRMLDAVGEAEKARQLLESRSSGQ